MPMSIQFYDNAIKTLVSPPSPVPPLQDIIMTIRKSTQINTLAQMGRDVLRGCVVARKYHTQIQADFLESVDSELNDYKLAIVAERSALLERLKVHDVATDIGDKAHILLAYLGAAFMAAFKEFGSNSIHDSINDICSMVLEPGEPSIGENNSHEKMARIAGVTKMPTPGTTRTSTPTKPEFPPRTFSSAAPSEGSRFEFDDGIAIDSISSGRSPPLPYAPHYQQPYQPYFYPPTSSNSPMHRSLLQPMHGPPIHSPFSSYALGTGPVHTGSPLVAPQPQYPMSPTPPQIQPSQMQPQMLPQAQPQPAFGAPPPPGGVPPGYGMGGPVNAGGFAAAPPPPAPSGPSAAIPAILPQQSQGYISLINEMAMKQRKTITWQTVKTGAQHMPEWTMWLYVDGQPRGQGTATTKQAAKELASKHALLNLGWAQG